MANKIIIDGQTVMQVAESYSELIEKPSINSVELVGNKTSSELGMYTSEEVDHLLAQSRSVKLSPTDPPENPEPGVLYYCDKQDPEDPTNYHVWLCDDTYTLIDLGDSKMDLAEKQDKEPKYQDEAGNVWYEIGHNPALIDDKLLTSHKVADAINEIDTILQEKQDKLDENLKTEDKSVVGAINELIIQVKELPTPSIDYLGKIYEYIGETDENYIRGRFYDCVKKEDEETGAISYAWEEVVGGSEGGGAQEWDATKTYVENDQVWVKDADGKYNYYFSLKPDNLGHIPTEESTTWWSLVCDNTITVNTMPAPSKVIFDSGMIYKFNGTTTADFVRGKEYVCIADGTSYIWQVLDKLPSYTALPTASKKLLSLVVKYTGATTKTLTKDHIYQCVLNGTAYEWEDITPPIKKGEPVVIELVNTVYLIVSDAYVTCIFTGTHSSTTPTTIPAKYRPKQTVWCAGTKDWTNFSGIASIGTDGKITLANTAFYGSCSWPIGGGVAVTNLGNSVKALYDDTTITIVFDGASNYHGMVIPQKFWPKQTVSCVCTRDWTTFRGLTWVNTSGVISCNSQTGTAFGSLSYQYANGYLGSNQEMPPIDDMWGGDYKSSETYTDGKIRFEAQNESKANQVAITILNKREFHIQGSFSCSKATVNNWFTIGYLRRNNTRIAWDKTCECVGCDGNLNPALVRFNNSYNDFRYIITKTPMSGTLYINAVVRVKNDLY